MPDVQFADPAVSRKKFNREIAEFRSNGDEYRGRGWFLAEAKFPHALVILATPKTQPITVLCGVSFDYSNYDAMPPSVRLVHPLTCEPYSHAKLPTRLPKRLPKPSGADPSEIKAQPLMVAHGPDEIPFLCIAGVREYHDHPAHTGDHWELHRASGAGRLVRLLEVISKYGLETVVGIGFQIRPVLENALPPE